MLCCLLSCIWASTHSTSSWLLSDTQHTQTYIHTHMPCSVPNRGDASDSEPFVNSAGNLDISRAGSRYTGRYVCIGVDVAGANATKRFYVEIEEEGMHA